MDWFLQTVNSAPPANREVIKSIIVLTLWEIWKERNSRVFRKEGRYMPKIMEAIFEEAELWAHAGNKGLQMIVPRHDGLRQEENQPVTANDVVAQTNHVN